MKKSFLLQFSVKSSHWVKYKIPFYATVFLNYPVALRPPLLTDAAEFLLISGPVVEYSSIAMPLVSETDTEVNGVTFP